MPNIPYITQEKYEYLYHQYQEDEILDIAGSEIVLGDSYFESSIITIFEHILFIHISSSSALAGKKRHIVKDWCRTNEFCYEGKNSESKGIDKGHGSIQEFIKILIGQIDPCRSFAHLRECSLEKQVVFANIIIERANYCIENN